MNNKKQPEFDKPLPMHLDAERFLLGSLLLDGERVPDVGGTLEVSEFAIEKHRRIYRRILDVSERGEHVDRVTVYNELDRHGETASVDGLSYLVSLDDGLPRISDLTSYIRIVKDKAALRAIALNAEHLMNRALTAEESPDAILAGAEESLQKISETRRQADEGLMHTGDFLRNFPGGFSAFVEPARRENGLRTGFLKYDEMTGGLRAGELTILAARPGLGKSAMATNITWNIASRTGVPCAIFSLEMSRESLLLRMLCGAARVDSHRLRSGYLNPGEIAKIRGAANQMLEVPIYIDDASQVGLMEIRAKVRKLERSRQIKVGLLVVDFLQLMASHGKAENRSIEVGRLARGLKLMSKEDQLNCPVIALSQLSRATETRNGDKKPQLSDLKDSGGLEENADVVAAIYRAECYKTDRDDLRGLAELILLKHRAGPTGVVDLTWLAAQQRFENRAEDLGDIPPEDTRSPCILTT